MPRSKAYEMGWEDAKDVPPITDPYEVALFAAVLADGRRRRAAKFETAVEPSSAPGGTPAVSSPQGDAA